MYVQELTPTDLLGPSGIYMKFPRDKGQWLLLLTDPHPFAHTSDHAGLLSLPFMCLLKLPRCLQDTQMESSLHIQDPHKGSAGQCVLTLPGSQFAA